MYMNIINTGRMFIIRQEGLESYLAYRLNGQELELYNAYVPEKQRGRGYASQLILTAFILLCCMAFVSKRIVRQQKPILKEILSGHMYCLNWFRFRINTNARLRCFSSAGF